jgi:cardiolipin synthase
MQRVLRDAARRGVDVRVILPAVSDLAALKHAALAEAPSWVADGIRVFEYRPAMLHSKASLVDDRWASVGTFNFNSTSVGLANEVNLIVRDRAFTAALARHMEGDLALCGEVTLASLARRRPLARALDRGARALVSIWDLLWGPRAALRSPARRLRAGPCSAGEGETHKLQAAPR